MSEVKQKKAKISAKKGESKGVKSKNVRNKSGESKKSQNSKSHKDLSSQGESKSVESQKTLRESKSDSQSNAFRLLFLAINEREKSLTFYQSLCGFNGAISADSTKLAKLQNANLQNVVDENLRAIFMRIAQKESEMLAKAKAILQKISVDSLVDSNADSADSSVDSQDSHINSNTDSPKSTQAILLPSALPDDILGELLREMGHLEHLNILALGVESHHLKTCDFLIKTAQQIAKNAPIIDMLYQLQALSYNHHIPLLNGESPKENANPNANQNANPSAFPPINSLSDLLKQSPLLSEFKSAFDTLQNIYAQTKDIVQKLERGALSQDELVAFLQKLRF